MGAVSAREDLRRRRRFAGIHQATLQVSGGYSFHSLRPPGLQSHTLADRACVNLQRHDGRLQEAWLSTAEMMDAGPRPKVLAAAALLLKSSSVHS